ncbi:MAG: transcription antitermination factor NusB [Endomicrobium sp.]|jgi:N utilization substance protein B|nr:transcription antitermination factor NusB [Endomicrobium sp.]
MSTRRQARECSLQMLYTLDNCSTSIESIYNSLDEYLPKDNVCRGFAINLFSGVCAKKIEIDCLIKKFAINWEIERMAVVDRNIIRIAAFEIIDTPDTPFRVIIDEAIEISKKYSTKNSSKFVNGILDKFKDTRTQKNINDAAI